MKLFCLLVVVGVVAGSEPVVHKPVPPRSTGYGGPDIYVLKEWTEALEQDLQILAKNISDATTLSAVIDDEILEIYDFSIAAITNKNKQQNDLASSYQAQVKALQHKVDAAKALEKQAISLAESTLASVTDQIDNYLNGSGVKGVNMEQQMVIDNLEKSLIDCKREYLTNLSNVITDLNAAEDRVESKIDILNDFVGKRKCEYGTGFVGEGVTTINFKTKFVVPPTVAVSANGFTAHLDKYKKHYDILSFNKEVKAESTEHFTLATVDKSEGQVDVKVASCSWMACQFLDKEVDLKDH